jgi:uncharacterized protein
VKYVLQYETGDMSKAMEVFPRHQAWMGPFIEDGRLLLIGPFDPPTDGALAVFTTREAADEFVAGDPFVLEGIVARHQIYAWNEILTD